MKIFIDTADLAEIREAAQMGVIDGVTTNPSLVAKTGKPMKEIIEAICEIVDGPISAEVLSTDFDGMVREGRELSKIHPNVVVKVPLIADGLRAVKVFAAEGIRTNVTLCFSPMQGMLAAKASFATSSSAQSAMNFTRADESAMRDSTPSPAAETAR